jgi:competence protein ComEC
MKRTFKEIAFFLLGILFFLNTVAWTFVSDLSSFLLEVNFFDVGQGDAIFIETPTSHQILIDGGPGPVILEKLGQEMPFWDRTLDLIILTHPEYDHINGLLEVLQRYKVDFVLWTGIKRDTAAFAQWEKLLKEKSVSVKIAQRGQKILWSSEGNNFMEIIFPFESLEGEEVSNTNNTSVVVKLNFGQNSFLFTGDTYQSIERKISKIEKDLTSDVLKVGHHGSKTSTASDFVEKVNPQLAVISVGRDNKYDHPHPETLETLTEYGIRILRTDQIGDIKIVSDGSKISLK